MDRQIRCLVNECEIDQFEANVDSPRGINSERSGRRYQCCGSGSFLFPTNTSNWLLPRELAWTLNGRDAELSDTGKLRTVLPIPTKTCRRFAVWNQGGQYDLRAKPAPRSAAFSRREDCFSDRGIACAISFRHSRILSPCSLFLYDPDLRIGFYALATQTRR